MSSTSIDQPILTIQDAIIRQTPTYDGWICPRCNYHKGGINCSANVFITCEGANTKNCIWFSRKRSLAKKIINHSDYKNVVL